MYWDFDLRDGVGDWSDNGCTLSDVREDSITCSCNHLTNFAVLIVSVSKVIELINLHCDNGERYGPLGT